MRKINLENTKNQYTLVKQKQKTMNHNNKYIIALIREKQKGEQIILQRAKQLEMTATAKNLEKMLKMSQKLAYAKAKMITYIYKKENDKYIDILYIKNNSYHKY
jgi:16S rRNA G1207 methylase RsmC